jgi:histidyl-tRNA synthetase
MPEKVSTKPASGTRDFLPDELRRRQHVIGVIRSVYERYGFEPLETPAFENIETLLGKYGDEGNKLIFKILKRGEHEASGQADLALRYDLTVPLARVVAQYQNELPPFFKRYQIQPVWRADRPGRGRFREFFQCDIDAVGSTSPVVEAEILGAVSDVMTALGFADFVVRVNHRRVLAALLEKAGVPPDKHNDSLVALDKLDKIGPDGVAKELATRGIDATAASAALGYFASQAEPPAATLARLRGILGGNDALMELETIVSLTPAAGRIRIDPSLARGLSYYTGAIMEIAVPDLAGSLGGGGRYDNLIGMFLGRDIPACGFSLGLERIIVVMTERKMFPESLAHGPADVMVSVWKGGQADAVRLASELRREGLRADVYPEEDKLGKQLKHAAARQIRFVAIVGDHERQRGEVNIKDLMTSHQESIPREGAANYITQRLRTNG